MPSDVLDNYDAAEIALCMAYYRVKQEDREAEESRRAIEEQRQQDRRRIRRR